MLDCDDVYSVFFTKSAWGVCIDFMGIGCLVIISAANKVASEIWYVEHLTSFGRPYCVRKTLTELWGFSLCNEDTASWTR